MASSPETRAAVLAALERIGEARIRSMMGGYCVYFEGKLIGLICGDRLFFKRTPALIALYPDAEVALPYEESRTPMTIVPPALWQDPASLSALIGAVWPELPEKKKGSS